MRYKVGDLVRLKMSGGEFDNRIGNITRIDGEYYLVDIDMGNTESYDLELYSFEFELLNKTLPEDLFIL